MIDDKKQLLCRKMLVATTIFLYIFCVLLVFVANLPSSAIYMQEKYKIGIKMFFPQGWAFFTKDPMNEQIDAYQIRNNNELNKLTIKNTDRKNYYGLRRESRLQGIEIGKLCEQIDAEDWIEIKSGFKSMPLVFKKEYTKKNQGEIVNIRVNPTICGNVLLHIYKPIPWAWVRGSNTIFPPCKIYKTYVRCDYK